MLTGTYIKEIELEDGEVVEIMRCPYCRRALGVATYYMDKVSIDITCPICHDTFRAEDPPHEEGK